MINIFKSLIIGFYSPSLSLKANKLMYTCYSFHSVGEYNQHTEKNKIKSSIKYATDLGSKYCKLHMTVILLFYHKKIT